MDSKERLERFFTRCRQEIAHDPVAAVPLALRGPDRVRTSAGLLADQFHDFLLQSLALLGSALTMAGNRSMADLVFKEGSGLDGVSIAERGGFRWRQSVFELYGSNWEKARTLARQAVEDFEASSSLRDDCSLSAALSVAGVVEGLAYQEGVEGFSRAQAREFFERALMESLPSYRFSRLAAVAGLGRVLVSSWMGAGRPRSCDVESLVRTVVALRAENVGFDLLDANLRWLLALALHRLLGGLGRTSERHIRKARDVFVQKGRPVDVRWITLDFQWCLIADGRFSAALQECDCLKEMQGLNRWKMAIAERLISDRLAKSIFRKSRGCRDVVSPQASRVLGRGWTEVGVGTGGKGGGSKYGF